MYIYTRNNVPVKFFDELSLKFIVLEREKYFVLRIISSNISLKRIPGGIHLPAITLFSYVV